MLKATREFGGISVMGVFAMNDVFAMCKMLSAIEDEGLIKESFNKLDSLFAKGEAMRGVADALSAFKVDIEALPGPVLAEEPETATEEVRHRRGCQGRGYRWSRSKGTTV